MVHDIEKSAACQGISHLYGQLGSALGSTGFWEINDREIGPLNCEYFLVLINWLDEQDMAYAHTPSERVGCSGVWLEGQLWAYRLNSAANCWK